MNNDNGSSKTESLCGPGFSQVSADHAEARNAALIAKGLLDRVTPDIPAVVQDAYAVGYLDGLRAERARHTGETKAHLPEYTREIGEAGDKYLKSVALDGRHVLPGMFRWYELWDAMRNAALPGVSEETRVKRLPNWAWDGLDIWESSELRRPDTMMSDEDGEIPVVLLEDLQRRSAVKTSSDVPHIMAAIDRADESPRCEFCKRVLDAAHSSGCPFQSAPDVNGEQK